MGAGMAQGGAKKDRPGAAVEFGAGGAFEVGQHDQPVTAGRDAGRRIGHQIIRIQTGIGGHAAFDLEELVAEPAQGNPGGLAPG